MTIHQPRSNVFTGFDRNLVLNQGEVTYFGTTKEVPAYFASIGHAIPRDYNPADFLIDVLFLECAASPSPVEAHHHHAPPDEESKDPAAGLGEVELVPVGAYGRQPSRATFQQRLSGGSSAASKGGAAAASPPRAVRVSIEEEEAGDVSASGSSHAGASSKEAAPVLPSASPRSHHQQAAAAAAGGGVAAGEPNPFALAFARSAGARMFREQLAALITYVCCGWRFVGY